MSEKLITVLLIIAIVVSVFSMVITLGLSTDMIPVRERTVTIIQGEDVRPANVGLTIREPSVILDNGE